MHWGHDADMGGGASGTLVQHDNISSIQVLAKSWSIPLCGSMLHCTIVSTRLQLWVKQACFLKDVA